MSLEAMLWALKEAPDVPAQCLGVLMGLADHADKRGRAAYPSAATLARYARKSERQVRYDLALLADLKLIRPGDQSEVAKYPVNRRPVVYDLAVERTSGGPSACAYCGDQADTTDHVIPVSRGGTDLPANRVPACGPCNSSKRDLTLGEWIATGRAPAGAFGVQSTAPQSGVQLISPRRGRGVQSTASQRQVQSTAPQTYPDLREHAGMQPTAPQVSDLLGCSGASSGVQPAADKPSLNLSQKLKDTAQNPPALADDPALFAIAPSPNGQRKPVRRAPNPRQVLADEITDRWWESNKATTAQSYIAIRNIVRTAVVNGLAPEVVTKAMDHLATQGTSISGGTIQTAMKTLGLVGRNHSRGGASDDLSGEDYSDGGTIL